MLLTATKRGDGYVLLQGNLGQYTTTDAGVVAPSHIPFVISPSSATDGNANCGLLTQDGQNYCDEPRALAYWQPGTEKGFLVVWPWNENLFSFQWTQPGGTGTQFTFAAPPGDPNMGKTTNPFAGIGTTATTGYAGGALMLTAHYPAESPAAAVVWAVAEPYPNQAGVPYCNQESGAFCLGYLLAYKLDGTAGALSQNPIWPSMPPTTTTVPDFTAAPFGIPTAVHGHVYVPTFSLCSNFTGGNCARTNYANYANAGVQAYY